MDYGAAGDNKTDDTQAVLKALAVPKVSLVPDLCCALHAALFLIPAAVFGRSPPAAVAWSDVVTMPPAPLLADRQRGAVLPSRRLPPYQSHRHPQVDSVQRRGKELDDSVLPVLAY